jgi:hypothetical protein
MMILRRVLCTALVLALAAYTTARAADPKTLPSDTELLVTINVKQILNSPLVKANQAAVNQGKKTLEDQYGDHPAMQLIKKAGFDLFKDMDTFTITTNGGKDPSAIIVEGKFNATKFPAAVEDLARENPNTLSITKQGGQAFYEITPAGEKALYATLINNKVLIAAADKEALTGAMARLEGTKKTTFKREFASLLSTTNAKQSFSFVATGAAMTKLMENPNIPNGNAAGAAFADIDGIAASFTIGKNIDFQLGLNAKDEPSARKKAKDWNSMIPVLQVVIDNQAQRDEKFAPLSDIIKSIKITSTGNNVLLKGTMSVDVIEALLNSIPQ